MDSSLPTYKCVPPQEPARQGRILLSVVCANTTGKLALRNSATQSPGREPPIISSRIEDYAVIGNCETMALVGLDGVLGALLSAGVPVLPAIGLGSRMRAGFPSGNHLGPAG